MLHPGARVGNSGNKLNSHEGVDRMEWHNIRWDE